MNDQEQTREQPVEEMARLREMVAELRQENAKCRSDCQRLESALQENDRRFKALLYNLPEKVFHKDRQSVYVSCNRNYAVEFGLEPEQMVGKTDYDLFPKAIAAKYRADDSRIMASGSTDEIEENYFTPTGEQRLIRTVKAALRDEHGHVTGILGIFSDITERKRAENALRQSESRYRALAEATNDVIYILDQAGKLLYANRTAAVYFGVSPEAIVGKAQQDLFPPEQVPFHLEHIRKVFETGAMQEVEVLYRFGPNDVWLNVRTIPLRDEQGRITSAMGVCRNITEQKRAEAALRESEQRMRLHVQQTPLAVIEWDVNGNVRQWNPGAERVFGYSDHEALGRPLSFVIPPRVHEQAAQVWDALLVKKGGERSTNENVTKDGRTILCEWYNTPLVNAEGQVIGVASLAEEITERKRAEEALRQAHDELEQKVKERTAELTEANELLQAEVEQRRQAEQAVRDSEERLQFALAVSQTGAWDLDLLDHTAHRSLQHDRIFGYQSLLPSWTYEMFLEHVLPEDREGVDDQFRQAVDTQSDWSFECRIRRSDGQIRWIWAAGRHRPDESGKPRRMAGIVQDITDRKKSEEEIRQSEAKYRALVESSPDAVAVVDLQGRLVFASQRTAEQHGVLHPDELLGLPATNLVVEGDRDRFMVNIRRLIEEGTRRNDQYRGIRKDGTTFDAEISSAVIRNAAGNPEALMGVYRDITERKQAEEELAIFGRFVEAATQGFRMSDLDGRITYMNPMMARLLGEKRPEDALGKNISAYHTNDYFRIRDEVLRPALRRDECWQGELPLLRRDGTVIPTIHNIFPMRDDNGNVHHFAVVVTDITELKRTEAALRQEQERLRASEERFELVVRGSGVGIWDWDLRTGKVYYSPRWKMLFGYDEDEIGEGVDDWASRLHPDEREWVIKAQDEFFTGTSMTATAEYRLRHKDGSYRWIIAHVLVVRDELGKAIRLVGSHGDITDRKLAEEKVKAEQKALHRMVMAGDRERHLLTYELHDGVAQQLLGAMMLFESQQASKGRKAKAMGDSYREGIDALRRATAEVRRVMNWLRTPVLDRFGLAEAIEDVAAQLRLTPGVPKIEYRHAVKFKRLEPTLENSLFRIAQEAMTNACRHSKSEKVHVNLTQKGDDVTLEVRDWGIGFDQDAIQEGRFGLEGIRERSRILGGKLSIESKPGQGTTVQVRFAVIEATDEE